MHQQAALLLHLSRRVTCHHMVMTDAVMNDPCPAMQWAQDIYWILAHDGSSSQDSRRHELMEDEAQGVILHVLGWPSEHFGCLALPGTAGSASGGVSAEGKSEGTFSSGDCLLEPSTAAGLLKTAIIIVHQMTGV